MKHIRTFVLVAVIASGACINEPCTTIAKAGIFVTIVDAQSGAPVAGIVTVSAIDGSYTESSPGSFDFGGFAFERPGTYRVEVQAPWYVTWVAPEVRVTEDECHVRTVDLIAELVKAGGG